MDNQCINVERRLSPEGQGNGHPIGNRLTRADSDWDEERQIFRKVLKTLGTYANHSKSKLKSTLGFVQSLPERHQELLSDYKDHVNSLHTFIGVNQNLFNQILQCVENMYENQNQIYGPVTDNNLPPLQPTSPDYDKLNSVMKQLCRDWSADGIPERMASYQPIIDEIEEEFKNVECKEDVWILVPGAGTGRLPHEIVRRGYTTQGNEFSMYMLFTANFILNKCFGVNQFTCYPWLHESVNVLHHHHQTRPILFPDVDPSDLPPGVKFSMTAGDFLEVYGSSDNQNSWNCIATSFFIDCATNIVAFIERIYGCLKDGGIWVNLGPLLYHYADLGQERSIEPPYDLLIPIINKIGFKLEKENLKVPTSFGGNPLSMLNYTYNSVMFVCRKTNSTQSLIPSQVHRFSLRHSDSLYPEKEEDGAVVAVSK